MPDSIDFKRERVDPDHPGLSVRRRCELLGLNLLRNVQIVRGDQVCDSDITYVPMPQGWVYLTVVMDWYSRYVLSWRSSNTLDGLFCLEALDCRTPWAVYREAA